PHDGWSGGDAGDVEPPEEGTGYTEGGAGAGGGIVIDASTAEVVNIASGAALESLGGRGQVSNGGTVKVFAPKDGREKLAISAGRVLLLSGPHSGNWFMLN